MLLSWLHLISLAVYLGSLVGLWVMVLPAVSALKEHAEQVKLMVRSLKIYNPLQTASLGVLILSGAFQLTALKAAYREQFFAELGAILTPKLMVSFLIIILSTYQTMALGHRLVRRSEGGEALSREEFEAVARRLKLSTIAILSLAAVTLWLGLRLKGA